MSDKTPEEQHKKYLEYIEKAYSPGQPCKVEWFIDDWSPIGPQVLQQLVAADLVIERGGVIFIK